MANANLKRKGLQRYPLNRIGLPSSGDRTTRFPKDIPNYFGLVGFTMQEIYLRKPMVDTEISAAAALLNRVTFQLHCLKQIMHAAPDGGHDESSW